MPSLAFSVPGAHRARAALLIAAVLAGSACTASTVPGPPSVRVAPGVAAPGGTVTVEGNGFASGASGDLAFDGSLIGMPAYLSDASGTFRMALQVPSSAAPGRHRVTALGSDGRLLAAATLTVTPGTEPAARTGGPGAGPGVHATATVPTGPGLDGIPAFAHVFVIVFENREYGSIVGSPQAPYLNALGRRYGLATAFDAVGHGIASYLALFSGSTHGIRDEGVYDIPGPNLFDQLQARGLSWRVYAQNVPGNCFMGVRASGGPDGPGTYVRRHEPAINFSAISGNPARCANITDLSHFDPAAANLEVIIPNTCIDMEDCGTAAGDAWLAQFVPRIASSPSFADSLLVVTYDEGRTNAGGGGHVATVLVGPRVRAHYASSMPHDDYSLLRTIEDAWRLPCLGRACQANNLGEFFR